MAILMALAAGFLAAFSGILCMIPGALGFYGWRFWQLMSGAKFSNQNRLYLVRLSTAITTHSLISRILFWLFRVLRFISVFFICMFSATPMMLIGLVAGFFYGAMKISYLLAINADEEYDTV